MRTAIAAALAAGFAPSVFALPVNPTVVNGSATFVQNGNVLTITNSNQAIINWGSFSIDKPETTRFVQPSASSSVLNRVLGNDPSLLLGTLQSNGRVFLINGAGILVGQGARIDVAAFAASTLNLSDSDFLANRMRFTENPGAGMVQNFGEITTPSGGSVYLVAPQVENSGIISAPNGEVLLAAGQRVELIDTASPGVRVEIVGSEGSATNLGTITAEAGRIGIAGVLVKNSGTLDTSSVVSEGGRIFLKATGDTLVDGDSRITATGTRGGRIEVLGNRVAVTGNAQLDASGQTTGGTVLVGGDYQGSNAAIQNSQVTYFGAQASIKADATDNGNDGKVIVWADDTTRAFGKISARGGANGGDGGFVETSGKRYLDFRAQVDTGATQGQTGTLLLDPANVYIAVDQATATAAGMSGTDTTSSSSGPSIFVSAGTAADSLLTWGTLSSALSSNNVVVHTDNPLAGAAGNIVFAGGSYSYASTKSLSLYAKNNIVMSGVTLSNSLGSGGGAINMIAGWNTSLGTPGTTGIVGDILLTNSLVNTNSGAMNIHAAGKINLTGSRFTNAGAFQTIQADSGAVEVWATASAPASIEYYGLGTQTVNGASISLLADTSGNSFHQAEISTHVAGSSQIIQASSGGISLTGGGYSIGVTGTNNSAGISAAGSQQVSATGAITLSAGGGASSNSAYIGSSGGQTISAANLSLLGGTDGSGNSASVSAQGSQLITLSGNLTIQGGSGATSYNNSAGITQNSATGSQKIQFNGAAGATMTLSGGSGSGTVASSDASCPGCLVTNNNAYVSNQGSGGQEIDFAATGAQYLTLTGGTSNNTTGKNSAHIDNQATTGTQKIWSSTGNRPAITLTGGASGGYYSAANNENIANNAEIGAKAAQIISASSIALVGAGDANTVGGAFLTGGTQNISTTGALTLTGGASNIAGMYGLGAAALIGEEFAANITLDVGGTLTMTGGTGSASAALIGQGVVDTSKPASSISITAGTGIAMNDGGSFSGIGTMTGDASGTLSMTTSAGGIAQGTASKIRTDSVTASAVADIALLGENKANSANLSSSAGNVDYHTSNALTTHVTANSVAGGSISLTGAAGSGNIALGLLDAGSTGTVSVSAQSAILDDNGTGVANIIAGTGGITLSSATGAQTAAGIAISADLSGGSGALSGTVAAGAYGGIRLNWLNSAAAPTSVTLSDTSTTAGQGLISYSSVGNILLNTISATTANGGISVQAGGNLTADGGTLSATAGSQSIALYAGNALTVSNTFGAANPLSLYAGGSMNINAAVASTGSSVALAAGTLNLNANVTGATGLDLTVGTLNVGSSATAKATTGNLNVVASDIFATGGKLWAAAGDVNATVSGSIRLNNGASIRAGNDVYLSLLGAASTLYLNETTGLASSYILAGSPTTIHLNFTARSADGVVIDGVQTATSLPGGSGLFVGSTSNPAVAGAGLDLRHGGVASNTPVSNGIIGSITAATDASKTGVSDSTGSSATLLTSAGSTVTSVAPTTVGGTDSNSFGGSESSSTTSTSTGSSSESGSGSKKEGSEEAKSAKKKPAQCT